MARLETEHIIPVAKGWLACPICNGHKSNKTDAIDPETGNRIPLFNFSL
jgi:hypothetical protein